jgi:cellulose synthase/poly-beta-1,6-N-acetylglucosamine synthase-like glycosyltransferase
MLFDMLILFILIVVIMLILSILFVEENPVMSIPLIFIGMIFSVLSAYGFFDVDFFYTGFNSTVGNTTGYIYSESSYYDPYAFVFLLIFFIFALLFIRAGFNLWKESLETKGTIDYKKR